MRAHAIAALALALWLLFSPLRVDAQDPGRDLPVLPSSLAAAVRAYALEVDALVARAQAREDSLLPSYVNASAKVHALLDLGVVRSAALATADVLGRERAVRLLRDAQLETDPGRFLRDETRLIVDRAERDVVNATQLVAFEGRSSGRLMAALYVAQIATTAQGYTSTYESLRQERAIETRLVGPATRASTMAALALATAEAVVEVERQGAVDPTPLLVELASRIAAFESPADEELEGNRRAALAAVEQESAPIALAHYLQMVRLRDSAAFAEGLAGASDPWSVVLENATAALAGFDAKAQLADLGYPTYLADETRVELELTMEGAPGIAPGTAAHADDVVRAITRARSMDELVELLSLAPADDETRVPLLFPLAPLALLVAAAAASSRYRRIPPARNSQAERSGRGPGETSPPKVDAMKPLIGPQRRLRPGLRRLGRSRPRQVCRYEAELATRAWQTWRRGGS